MVPNYTDLELMQARINFVPKDWIFSTIGQSYVIKNNLRKPINETERSSNPGPYPYYGPTKIQDYIGSFEQDGDYVLIGEDGDHFLKYETHSMTQLVEGKCTINNHAHIIEGTSLASRKWFYYYFMHRDIFSFLSRQGAGRYKLNKASLEKLPILIPPIQEQQKITEILSTWDKAIASTEKLIVNSEMQKKALMQQLLTGKKRLLDEDGDRFSGEWEKIIVKNIFKLKTETSGSNTYKIYSVTKNGLINQQDYFNKEVASADTSKYKIVHTNEFVMSGLNFWMGSVDIHLENFSVIVSPAYKTYKISKKFNILFLKYFVRSTTFLKVLIGSSVMGASIVRRNFNSEIFENWSLSIPKIQEQKKIAEVLSNADREIELLKAKLEHLQQEKKALMQQLLTGKRRVVIN